MAAFGDQDERIPPPRDAQAVQEWVYPARRRGVDSSALPLFSPLFCTAVDARLETLRLTGLSPGREYTLTIVDLHLLCGSRSYRLVASPQGGLEMNLQDLFPEEHRLENASSEVVWLLEAASGATLYHEWTSGMIWLESDALPALAQDLEALFQEWDSDLPDAYEMQDLMEISLLLSWERYVQAYDRARRLLVHQKHAAERHTLFEASLWNFIQQSLEAMLSRINSAEPIFRSIKTEWDAVASLRDLLDDIAEKA